MAANVVEKTIEKPLKSPTSGAESPTTARELDFDDDTTDTPPSSTVPTAKPATASAPYPSVTSEDEPPPKPPRPMSPRAQAEAILMEMFPGIEKSTIKVALVASNGELQPAIDILLKSFGGDDDSGDDEPPAKPPRRTAAQRQLAEDERLARQLDEHYRAAGSQGYGARGVGDPQLPGQRRQTNLKPNELYDNREHSFFDDDLPVIQENIRKGFIETQSKVNKWFNDFRKKIDGEEEDEFDRQANSAQQRQNYQNFQRNAERSRPSGDRVRYDDDPREIGDDFTALKLQDNDPHPSRSNRPLANPDLFKPTPTAPQSGAVDEVDALYHNATPQRQPSPNTAGKTKKWQPLTSIAPNPEADDHDPFSLGDSDDEDAKTKDIKAEDTERLKKAAADSPVSPIEDRPMEAAERSGSMGTRDNEAERLLTKETKAT